MRKNIHPIPVSIQVGYRYHPWVKNHPHIHQVDRYQIPILWIAIPYIDRCRQKLALAFARQWQCTEKEGRLYMVQWNSGGGSSSGNDVSTSDWVGAFCNVFYWTCRINRKLAWRAWKLSNFVPTHAAKSRRVSFPAYYQTRAHAPTGPGCSAP
jgi:hypothetical protein